MITSSRRPAWLPPASPQRPVQQRRRCRRSGASGGLVLFALLVLVSGDEGERSASPQGDGDAGRQREVLAATCWSRSARSRRVRSQRRGISEGLQRSGSSRNTWRSLPPMTTPLGLPVRLRGTFTSTTVSSVTSMKSACSNFARHPDGTDTRRSSPARPDRVDFERNDDIAAAVAVRGVRHCLGLDGEIARRATLTM